METSEILSLYFGLIIHELNSMEVKPGSVSNLFRASALVRELEHHFIDGGILSMNLPDLLYLTGLF